MTMSLAPVLPARDLSVRDRSVPVDEVLAGLLPEAGLRRGHVVGCVGPAAMSLALVVAARAIVAGSWLAIVGVPTLGVEAAAELGVPLSRLVSIDAGGSPAEWADRVAAAADGFEIVLTCPPPGAERLVRKIRQRLQARGVVLLAVFERSPSLSCDMEFTTSEVWWSGIGYGHGGLRGRQVTIRLAGRRMPRPAERVLWLPGPNGEVRCVDELPGDSANDASGTLSQVG